ncbi:MAG: glycosyltransferase family 39 protein [Candidatus Binataceae bacterium]
MYRRLNIAEPKRGAVVAAAAALAAVLLAGIVLRTVALGSVPAGLHQDEACNGYDAYCILKTGRDQHGHPLPLAFQAFNDYRMPLFDYSLVPLIGIFGLKTWVVRFGAALWGVADLIAIAALAWELIGLPAAPIAVALAAVSPWHLVISRFGTEESCAAAIISWAIVCFLWAIRRRDGRWLAACGFLFGLSLYGYSTTKLFVPLLAGLLLLLYWRELRPMMRWVGAAALIFAAMALPQAWLIAVDSAAMQARYNQLSILNETGGWWRIPLNWLTHFSPDFLFGGANPLFILPKGLAPLLPAQELMAVAGIAALFDSKRRRTALLLIGWIAAASVPGALLRPAPEPNALHDYLIIVPWALFSALGAIALVELPVWKRAGDPNAARGAQFTLLGGIMALALIQGAIFAHYYFTGFSTDRETMFAFGTEKLVRAAERLAAPGETIDFPLTIRQGYIYPLFFNAYPPRRFQSEPIQQAHGLFGRVRGFDRYRFGNPWRAFEELPHGVFVFPQRLFTPKDRWQPFPASRPDPTDFPAPPARPAMVLHLGKNIYRIVVK